MNLWGNRDFSDVVNLRDRQGRFSWIIRVLPVCIAIARVLTAGRQEGQSEKRCAAEERQERG